MSRLWLLPLISALGLLTGCASTQRMHFAEFSEVNFTVARLEPLRTSTAVYLGDVTGGDYANIGEFSDYSWHGFLEGRFEGFLRLPYHNPNAQIKSWISDILSVNKLLSQSPAPKLDVVVRRWKMKTQKDGRYDYRACLVELQLVLHPSDGTKPEILSVEGLAKLPGSEIRVLSETTFEKQVSFGPDNPPICKLAIANALRSKEVK